MNKEKHIKLGVVGAAGGSGLGLFGVLTIIFVVLKVLGVISWAWVWVLSPLWIATGLSALCLVLFAIVMGLVSRRIEKKRKARLEQYWNRSGHCRRRK